MVWACEVGSSHGNRVYNILTTKHVDIVALKGAKPLQDPVLMYSRANIVNAQLVPADCCKHFHRMFYVPYSCTDIGWIFQNPMFCDLLRDETCVFKVSASPKTLERAIAEMLMGIGNGHGTTKLSPKRLHPTQFTHIFNCVYSPEESLFRWGIVSKEDSVAFNMTSDALLATAAHATSALAFPPVCRAYYKMQEILDFYFPKADWAVPKKEELLAVDVGASPGGWSQCLSPRCRAVLSIDPGLLHPDVLCLPNVTHVPFLAEAPATQDAIDSFTDRTGTGDFQAISLCVCDVNFEAHLAAKMLTTHIVIPHMGVVSRDGDIQKAKENCAYVILTLKLQRNPSPAAIERNYRKACSVFLETLPDRDIEFQLVHLNANSRNERTLLCRIK